MHYLGNLSPVMFFSGKFSVLFLNGGGGGGAELAILLLQASLPVLLLLLHSNSLKRKKYSPPAVELIENKKTLSHEL